MLEKYIFCDVCGLHVGINNVGMQQKLQTPAFDVKGIPDMPNLHLIYSVQSI